MADTLYTISVIANDSTFAQRLYAGAAQENASGDPVMWVSTNRYQIAAAPTWAEKVDYWLANHPTEPGDPPNNGWALDTSVISDNDIISQIQYLLGSAV